MRYLLSLIVTFAWALWFGGLVALIIFVMAVFNKDRPIPPENNSRLFLTFEYFHLSIAAISVVGTFLWYELNPSFAKVVLFFCLMVSAFTAAVTPRMVNRIIEMQLGNQTKSEQFHELHRRSKNIYGLELSALFVAGLFLPASIKAKPRKKPGQVEEPRTEC